MEKLRIKLNVNEVSVLGNIFLIYSSTFKFNTYEDISDKYLIMDVINRLASISIKGGRLSINPAEAVSLLKMIRNNNFISGDIYVQNIINKFFSDLHKYLSDLL